MRLVQFNGTDGRRRIARTTESGELRQIEGFGTVYGLATQAIAEGRSLAEMVGRLPAGSAIDYDALAADRLLLPPLDHPDPAHIWVTGTGLTHLGSADARDKMHTAANAPVTDSMKMFRAGLEGGKPAAGQVGTQPEWFYKGDGACVAAPGQPLAMPDFSLDGGEEPEVCGVYLIGPDGTPWRLGFALANEFSDHVTERQNYLLLAHSKLRAFSFGPELLTGPLPDDVRGTSRIRRGGKVLWEKEFLSGEANMSHSVANLEHHHFKYRMFRRPGDVHIHTFGTATLSVADGVKTEPGDAFEIDCALFGRPLINPLAIRPAPTGAVRSL